MYTLQVDMCEVGLIIKYMCVCAYNEVCLLTVLVYTWQTFGRD